ncbi:hypothetical protein HDU97_009706 [Phlyctochytrium planicorne]|nr:hypothetical protein HDU97_009706 [Phlyctochytrium planicorne]
MYFLVLATMLRFEHFTTPTYLYYPYSSFFQVLVIVIMCLIGTAVRYISSVIFFIFCSAFVLARGIAYSCQFDAVFGVVQFLAFISPTVCVVAMVMGRFANFEQVVRLEFISYKRLQVEMARQTEQKKTLASLLDIMLPKSVIPRLIDSNFKFSTVSDRFDNAFCLFIDFFNSAEIKELEFEVTATLLNETFKSFDTLLREFPTVEKIKTIGSKAMLVYHPPKTESLEAAADLVTMLAWELVNRMFVLSSEETISVQAALLYQLPNDYDFPKRNIQVGVAFGPVVAGIVGEERFVYDVYGDTVNVASRLQSLGLGNILATKEYYNLLGATKREYLQPIAPKNNKYSGEIWIPLGLQPVKGRGELEIYELSHPSIPKAKTKRTTMESISSTSSNPPLQMRRRLSSNGLSRRQGNMSSGIGEIVRRQNRPQSVVIPTPTQVEQAQTQSLSGRTSATNLLRDPHSSSQIHATSHHGSPRSQPQFPKHSSVPSALSKFNPSTDSVCSSSIGDYVNAPPVIREEVERSMLNFEEPKACLEANRGNSGILATSQLDEVVVHPTVPCKESVEVVGGGGNANAISPAANAANISAPTVDAGTFPNGSTNHVGSQHGPNGSAVGVALAQSASIILSGGTNGSRSMDVFSMISAPDADPFHPVIEKVHPLLAQGKAQDLYEAVANFLKPGRLDFKDAKIEKIFRKSKLEMDATINSSHVTWGILVVMLLLVTAILHDYYLQNDQTIRPYAIVVGAFGIIQAVISLAQIRGFKIIKEHHRKLTERKRTLTKKKNQRRPRHDFGLALSIFFASHVVGYALNVLPMFGVCFTLSLYSGYGRDYEQASGAIIQNFLVFVFFIRNSSVGLTERLIIISVLGLSMIITHGIAARWDLYAVITTIACHLLLHVVLHRMECVTRTDFLLREALVVSKVISDRQNKLSTGLLNAILPQRIMTKLIQNIDLADKSAIIDFFDYICVLHTDITSFTVLSSKIEPDALIKVLNTVFSFFDKICRAHGVEKILTVGDAYIAAHTGNGSAEAIMEIFKTLGMNNVIEEGTDQVPENDLGLPRVVAPQSGFPRMAAILTTRTALCMTEALENIASNGTAFAQIPGGKLLIRAGVHSGTARGFVTGGFSKIKYELFGEAVDRAEKIQEMAIPGTVFTSKDTMELISPLFDVDPKVRGTLKDGTECHLVRGLIEQENKTLLRSIM